MTKPEVHFLQSAAWADFQRQLGRQTIDKSDKNWQYMTIVEHGRWSNRLYCPYGPTCTDKTGLTAARADLMAEATARNLDFIRVEPMGDLTEADLTALGLKRKVSHFGVQPISTVINDVSGGPEAITASVSQKVRRYARKAEKQGLTYSVSHQPDDIKHYIDMIHDVAARTGMKPMSDHYFETIASALFPTGAAGLLFGEYQGKKIASIVYYKTDSTLYYAHAANYTEYRALSPANGLGLYALLFAHEQGCNWFDWYGIASDKADNSSALAGITQFKLSFGGQVKNYLGTWELPINKSKYRLYKTLLKVKGEK
jgi:lipid II:glycine glycyltransferase (peptidoglycan interpeptide bridge formation enzyme)